MPFFSVTVASSLGCRTYTEPSKASQYIELLTATRENAVITIRHGGDIEERAVVQGVHRSDLAIERLEIQDVEGSDPDVAPVFVCRALPMETPPDEDFICPNCGASVWLVAILEEDNNIARRLRTCRACGHQETTREMRSIGVGNRNSEDGAMETFKEEIAISDRAREIVSWGATDNPEEEITIAFSEIDGEVTVFRIFRGRHTDGDPEEESDRWIRKVKEECVSLYGEIKTKRAWSDSDGGSVNAAIIGRGIVAKEELESQ